MSRSALSFNILVILLIGCVLNQQIDFRATYQTSGACVYGRLQSPIDLLQWNSSYNSSIYLTYDNYVQIPNAQLSFNGRALALNQTSGALSNYGYIGFARVGVLKQYSLVGIEVIYPGEHRIEGQQPDVEVQFIHQKNLGFETSLNQYRKITDPNMYLIISILYKKTSFATDNGFLSDLLSTWSGFPSENGFSYKSSYTLDIDSYGVLGDKPYYFYDGSFTHAPCDENVNRIVYRDMYYISSSQLNFLSLIYKNYYTGGVMNKAIAQSYGRRISRNFMNITEAASSFLSVKFLTLVAVALTIFAF